MYLFIHVSHDGRHSPSAPPAHPQIRDRVSAPVAHRVDLAQPASRHTNFSCVGHPRGSGMRHPYLSTVTMWWAESLSGIEPAECAEGS